MNCPKGFQSTQRPPLSPAKDENDNTVSGVSDTLKVKSEGFKPYYAITPTSPPLGPLPLWASEGHIEAVNRGETHLCVCQLGPRQGGKKGKLRSTVHGHLFPHISANV